MNHPLKIGQPRFLSLDEVLTLHRASLDAYGGADGVIDQGKLESSLAMPGQGFSGEYAHEFPFGMAAAYGFHLAMNHAFRDGNKRTAFAAMVVFLRMNGWNFELPDEEAAALMLEMIEQRRDKAWLVDHIRSASRSRTSMELRDFFSMLQCSEFSKAYASLCKTAPGATVTGFESSASDAESAMATLSGMRQWILEYQESSSQEEIRTLYRGFVAIFRLAEDMGYEW